PTPPPSRSALVPYTTLFRSRAGSAARTARKGLRALDRVHRDPLSGDHHGRCNHGRTYATRTDHDGARFHALRESDDGCPRIVVRDRKSTRLNSSHVKISDAV